MNSEQLVSLLQAQKQDLDRALLLRPDDMDLMDQWLAVVAQIQQQQINSQPVKTAAQMPPRTL
jgi:hypothetical protein